MLTPLATARDILVFQQQDGSCLTMAADTLGAIGEKAGDHLCVPPETCGRMTARVCLLETLAVGAVPTALLALICNERDPTGLRLLAGIHAELAAAGFPDIPVGGSSEDNVPTQMTALGITLLGECQAPAWRRAQTGDGLYLLGLPYVGPEVVAHAETLVTAMHLRHIRALPAVGDILPCGSRGIAWELQVLQREIALPLSLTPEIDSALLTKSAGPATCALVTAREPFTLDAIPVLRLGAVGGP